MRLLILGGSGWFGGVLARDALAHGHDVTCLARGESGELPAGARSLVADRDRSDAYRGLDEERWDVVVDVASQPGHVRRAVSALADSASFYCFISSVSVYRDLSTVGQDEAAPVLDPLDADVSAAPEQYGSAKLACETHVLEHFGAERSLLVRAGLIGGAGDPSQRSGYWPSRFAHLASLGERVLVPDPAGLTVQLIDVRDLASWVLGCAERRWSGTYNATGDSQALAHYFEIAREEAGHTGALVAAETKWLLDHGVQPWMGERSFPLWSPGPEYRGLSTWDNSAARSAGLHLRPPRETIADTLSSFSGKPSEDAVLRAGLTLAQERELLGELAP